MEYLAATYTSNQTGAIATLLAGALGASSMLMAAYLEGLLTTSVLTVFAILVIIAWLLVPLYAKRIRWGFIVGLIVIGIAFVGIASTPGTLYGIECPICASYNIVMLFVLLACIYFSYKSYKEL